MPNFIEIEETFCGQTDARTNGHLRLALLGRLCRRVNLKMENGLGRVDDEHSYKQHLTCTK